MKHVVAVAAVFAGACLVTLPATDGAVAAARPTCQGEQATMVGKPSRALYGRSGRDVIVTNGSTYVNGRGGNDLLCITGSSGRVLALGESGDDRVLVLSKTARVDFSAGTGSDTYVGNGRGDRVSFWLGGQDRASTGRGGDRVSLVVTQPRGKARVRLGTGDDEFRMVVLDKGNGTVPDSIAADLKKRSTVLGAGSRRHGLDVRGADDLSAENFAAVVLAGDGDDNDLTAINACAVELRGRPGNDTLRASSPPNTCTPPATSTVDGGRGIDSCFAASTTRCEDQATRPR